MAVVQSAPNAEEWATFLHQPDKVRASLSYHPSSWQIYTNFDEVRAEIEAQTNRIVGPNKVGFC